MATDVARLALQIDVTGAQRARQALAGLKDGSIRATKANQQLALSNQQLVSTARRTTGAFRLQKGALQQAGFQIQDFAVQVGSGQSALVAFGQQGSQLAGILGPGGALIGAVIAIGSVVGGIFANSIMDGGESVEDLTEKTRDLVTELGKATESQRQFINASFAREMAEQERAVREAERSIQVINGRLENFRKQAGDNVPDAVFNANSAVKGLRQELDDARLVIDNATSSTEAIAKAQEEFWKEVEETGNKADDATEKLNSFVDAIVSQGETVGMTARQTAIYEAKRLGANEADLAAIRNAYDFIEAEKLRQEEIKRTEQRQREARKALMESTKIGADDDPLLQRIEAEKRGQEILIQQQKDYATARQSLDQSILSSAASTAGNLASVVGDLAGRQSDAYRAAFVAQQAFAIASSIVNTQMAAAAALAPPPIGLGPVAGAGYANTIQALGAANIAIIAGQTISGLASSYSGGDSEGAQSFEGGGYTGSGSRTGGIDGRGGFPAILHPNETVVDHTRGQSAGGSMIVNVNNAPQGTRVEQRTDNQGNQIADVFIADVASGGPMSKTMQSTFGLRRQGR